MEKYVFKNNGFKILWKPMSALLMFSSLLFTAVFIGMVISDQYTLLESLKVFIMVPAVNLLMLLFFSTYFFLIYFVFIIEEEEIRIITRFHEYTVNKKDVTSVVLNLKVNEQHKLVIKTDEQKITLYLIGQGGRFIYKEFFERIKKLKLQ
jgi:hypothetical protein